MGKTANYILVIIISCCSLISLPCFAKVNAEDYDAFWLWSGVNSQPVLENANTIYLLSGQIVANYNQQTYFIKQGNPIKSLEKQQLWLVYRAHTLNWSDNVFNTLNKQLKKYHANGIEVVGIQIDFDVATKQLAEYVAFLNKVRQWLPSNYRLSITGLLDWGNNADITTINQLGTIVDEVVFQSYQGKNTITNYQQYLPKLKEITIPFKIGIIQYGAWQAPSFLTSNPNFKGYVVFLQNAD